MSGIANRYGSDRKYVDLCDPLGSLEILNPFRTYAYDAHSLPKSIQVNKLLYEKYIPESTTCGAFAIKVLPMMVSTL